MTVKEVARIRNEVAVSYFKVLFNHLPGNTNLTTSSHCESHKGSMAVTNITESCGSTR